ncbi:unnamed protein product, partial [Cladocopium goreaui]
GHHLVMEFPSHAAWLDFRSPEDEEAGAWQRRWAVLHCGELNLFQDESCKRRTARLALPRNLRALAFGDPRAPHRAAQLRGQRPQGFLLELNPLDAEDDAWPSGEFRQLLLFEAPDEQQLQTWLERFRGQPATDSIQRPAPESQPKLPGMPLPAERNRFFPSPSHASEFDIDDFSDYEDDTHARASSLHALERSDWTSPTARRVHSRPRRERAPSPSGRNADCVQRETSGEEVKLRCSNHLEVNRVEAGNEDVAEVY